MFYLEITGPSGTTAPVCEEIMESLPVEESSYPPSTPVDKKVIQQFSDDTYVESVLVKPNDADVTQKPEYLQPEPVEVIIFAPSEQQIKLLHNLFSHLSNNRLFINYWHLSLLFMQYSFIKMKANIFAPVSYIPLRTKQNWNQENTKLSELSLSS